MIDAKVLRCEDEDVAVVEETGVSVRIKSWHYEKEASRLPKF